MPAKPSNQPQIDATTELLGDLLIVELAKAGVPQSEIRKIVGCDMRRVSRIAKVLKKAPLARTIPSTYFRSPSKLVHFGVSVPIAAKAAALPPHSKCQ